MNNWTVTLEEDPETGELIMPLTPDMLSQVGWDVGDTLIWEELPHGNWSLRKDDGKPADTAE